MRGTFLIATLALVATAAAYAQVRGGGGPEGPPPAGVGRGNAPPALGAAPKPAIRDAKPIRSCESLAAVALPNTTIESAALDPGNPAGCARLRGGLHRHRARRWQRQLRAGCEGTSELAAHS